MNSHSTLVLAVVVFVLLTALLAGVPLPNEPVLLQTPTRYVAPRGYVCCRAPSPIKIDGRIDESAWQAAPWSEDFVDIEGDARPKPRFRTRVKMLWDDQQLFIAAELEEPHVTATFTEHDSYIFHEDNDFEVFLDPDCDNHLYAELEMNARNTTWDLLLTKPYQDQGRPLDAWEITGLRTAVHVNGTLNDPRDRDRGWTLEIAWPWKGLQELSSRKLPPRDGEQWRINFSRVEWEFEITQGKYRRVAKKKENNWVWSPQHAIDMHRPEHWGILQFSAAPPGSASFRPDPTGPARHALHRIHEAQIAYRKKHHCWARTLHALGLDSLRDASFGAPKIETTDQCFEASVAVNLPEGRRETWSIRSSGRIAPQKETPANAP